MTTTALSQIERGKLPTVMLHLDWFEPESVWKENDAGETVEYLVWSTRKVGPDSALLPEDTCRRIIAEVDATSDPAPRSVAKELAKLLIGCYPKRELNDPRIYSRALVSVFEEAPADLGVEAVDEISRTLKFIPTRAEVVKALEAKVSQRRYAKMVAEAQLKENARRKSIVPDDPPMTPEELETKTRALAEENGVTYRDGMGIADVLGKVWQAKPLEDA